MLSLEIGRYYSFSLFSGRTVEIVVLSSHTDPSGVSTLTLSVNGVQGTYSSVNQALGEHFVHVDRV